MFAGLGHATFELRDPAAEAMNELEQHAGEGGANSTAVIYAGNSACSDYVRGRKKRNDDYWSALKWLVEYMNAASAGQSVDYDPDAMARWIDDYCQGNPGDSLNTAAEAFVKSDLDGA